MVKIADSKKRESHQQHEDHEEGEQANLEILDRLERAAQHKKLVLIEVPKDVEIGD